MTAVAVGSARSTRTALAPRLLALSGVLVLTIATVAVLLDITAVVGGSVELLLVVAGSMAAALVVSSIVGGKTAVVVATLGSAAGFSYYLWAADITPDTAVEAATSLSRDTVALVSGLSILRMVEAGIWTLGFAPGPIFLTWYLALRRRYAWSVLVGGTALGFLVLTGDATGMVVLVGGIGAVAAVGFGELELRDGSLANADLIAIVVASAVVLSLGLTGLSGGALGPLGVDGGPSSLDEAIGDGDEVTHITGSVDLSDEVRFKVEGDRERYWRTGVYDRFTGDSWISTGDTRDINDGVDVPRGYRVQHTIHAESAMGSMPAAAHPVDVRGDAAEFTVIDDHGQIRPITPLLAGDGYTVESVVVDPPAAELQRAGTNYPAAVENRYLQLPEGTSEAFHEVTASVTADAETPYEATVAIEAYLRSNYGYSLDIEQPDGNVAEAFLLEMDEGYCVYFATTMVQMLRAEEIPARYATGYTSGEYEDGEWVVRGYDAHAWVEVYFPGVGWVEFEPTPAGPREEVHGAATDDGNEEIVPPDGGGQDPDNTTQQPTNDSDDGTGDESGNDTDDTGGVDDSSGGGESGGDGPAVSLSPSALAALAVVLVGAAATVRRTGLRDRAASALAVRYQRPTGSPSSDVCTAADRLELILARTHRPRHGAETLPEYLAALDLDPEWRRRVDVVAESHDLARYGPGVDQDRADRVRRLVDELADEALPGPVPKIGRPVGRGAR